MNQQQRFDIIQTLGHKALVSINNGNPELIETETFAAVAFWVNGIECEYFFNTSPPLLRIVETDKEVSTFDQLLSEITYELA
jgi:hypothetical protein